MADKISSLNAAPVAEIAIEPGYWSRGHFYEGKRKILVETADIQSLPVGTKLALLTTVNSTGIIEPINNPES